MLVGKKRTIIVFTLINLLLIAASFGFYYVYINAFEKKYVSDYIDAFQEALIENVDESLVELVDLFDEQTSINTVNNLNTLLTVDGPLKSKGFVKFFSKNGDDFTFQMDEDGIVASYTVELNKSYLADYRFGFVDKYLYIFNNNVVGIVNYQTIFDSNTTFSNAEDIFIMSNQGEIYFNRNKSFYSNVLHLYLPEDTNPYFERYFSKNLPTIIYSEKGDEDVAVGFVPLNEYQKLYVAQLFYKDTIRAQYLSFNTFILLLFLALGTLNVATLFFLYYTVNKKIADVEHKKIQHFYAKPYVVTINRKGKILKKNLKFINDFVNEDNKYTHIDEMFKSKTPLLEKIERGVTLYFKSKDKAIGFIPVKFNRGFYLVGTGVEGVPIEDESVYQLAYYNQSTDLANMHLFEKEITEMLNSFVPTEEQTVYFIGFEIRGFKNILTYFTKSVTDSALKEAAIELIEATKDNNVSIYHPEMDKFVVVINEPSFKVVEDMVLNIIRTFEKPLLISESKIDLKVSVGIVPVLSTQSKFLNSDIIYSQISETLKRSHQITTSKYLMFDETITHFLTEKQQMEKDLEKAIKKKEFIPYLQAQYNHKENRIVGFEALIRWDHPRYIKKSPQAFIELAEENGMIDDIGRIMMERTFEAAKELEEYDVTISLNISPVQMLRQGFTDELLNLHRKFNLKPGSITVEITETTLIQSFAIANEKLKILKRNGIGIDLDDFGTGYSSLPYIKELNFDTIKIDKTFVDYIETDRYNKAIVQMIISLAKTLKANVIAEGVETERQMNHLVKAGCQIIQGFYISKPLPLEEAKKLLDDYNVNKTKSFKKGGNK